MKPRWSVALRQQRYKASNNRNSPNKSYWPSSFPKPNLPKHFWSLMASNSGARDSEERWLSSVSSHEGRDTQLCTCPREQWHFTNVQKFWEQTGEIGKWNREKWKESEFREQKPGTKPRFSGRTKHIRNSRKGLEWGHGCCGREPWNEKVLPPLCSSWCALNFLISLSRS